MKPHLWIIFFADTLRVSQGSAVDSSITRSRDPNSTIASGNSEAPKQFFAEINDLVPNATMEVIEMPPIYSDPHWTTIDALTRYL